jgi:hypothetical protein
MTLLSIYEFGWVKFTLEVPENLDVDFAITASAQPARFNISSLFSGQRNLLLYWTFPIKQQSVRHRLRYFRLFSSWLAASLTRVWLSNLFSIPTLSVLFHQQSIHFLTSVLFKLSPSFRKGRYRREFPQSSNALPTVIESKSHHYL